MKNFLSSLFSNSQQNRNEANASISDTEDMNKHSIYVSDSPVESQEQDKFKRWPFSQRIAQTIISRKDPSSFIVGIYGPWGDGKTTVLNFIEKELKESSDVK